MIQNPSYAELQKSANQGRRCTWEKLSAIKANCGIELALDECVAVLNHMRRLKRSADRAAATSPSPCGGPAGTSKFIAHKRIPSWNVMARENSTGSLEEDLVADPAGPSGVYAMRSWRTLRCSHDGSDSESEGPPDLVQSWTRSGGPLMRTTSADKFVDFVHNLEALNSRGNRACSTTSDTEYDERDSSGRALPSAIVVAQGDLLQPERVDNGGIMFNVVKRSSLMPASRSSDSEHYDSLHNSPVDELVQHESLDDEMDEASSISDNDAIVANEGELDCGRQWSL